MTTGYNLASFELKSYRFFEADFLHIINSPFLIFLFWIRKWPPFM